MMKNSLKLEDSLESRTTFMERLNVNFVILGALKENMSTSDEIKQYAAGKTRLAGIDLSGHLSRLEGAYFIESLEGQETGYRLLDRGKRALKKYSTSGVWGLESFIRGQILEIDGISTTNIIRNYEIMFGMPKAGKYKSSKKLKVINKLESMMKSRELDFSDGGWHYKKPK